MTNFCQHKFYAFVIIFNFTNLQASLWCNTCARFSFWRYFKENSFTFRLIFCFRCHFTCERIFLALSVSYCQCWLINICCIKFEWNRTFWNRLLENCSCFIKAGSQAIIVDMTSVVTIVLFSTFQVVPWRLQPVSIDKRSFVKLRTIGF